MVFIYLLLHLLTGLGIVAQFEGVRKRAETIGLSLLLGMGAHTLLIFFMELLHIRFTASSVLTMMLAASLLTNANYKASLALFQRLLNNKWDFKLYDIPFVLLGAYFVYVSSWRAFYVAVTPYDAMVGMDMVAKYAAAEGHILSSAFTHPNLQGHVQNQMYYAPFTTFLQLMYRLAGHTVGQTWLGVVFGAFSLWFYGKLRDIAHPILAGFALLLLTLVPEMYGYTFMFLTDYSSAVFFTVGVVYFGAYFNEGNTLSTLILSALGFGLSLWSRSDGAIFIFLGAILLFASQYRSVEVKQNVLRTAIWAAIPLLFFVLWNVIFFQLAPRAPVNQISEHAGNIGELLGKFSDIVKTLIIGESQQISATESMNYSRVLYGYSFPIFFLFLIANTALFRNKKGWEALAWMLVLFVGFGLIAHLFVAATVENTIKRGFFKMFPLIYLFICSSALGQWLSEKMKALEGGTA